MHSFFCVIYALPRLLLVVFALVLSGNFEAAMRNICQGFFSSFREASLLAMIWEVEGMEIPNPDLPSHL